ncbi:hypothetical protein [Rhodopseudomonas palustris]|uniref:hypothetical protein n=1 Tax=Rhodopseudomonas palustris TaxID=1076 RepID=UPI000D219D30|nr:hypothetical protein [Rhodopseudomonas palustris]AVT83682.1 hypothetical protein RPYSC3_48220 [Rhodopseudomonas palustris]
MYYYEYSPVYAPTYLHHSEGDPFTAILFVLALFGIIWLMFQERNRGGTDDKKH